LIGAQGIVLPMIIGVRIDDANSLACGLSVPALLPAARSRRLLLRAGLEELLEGVDFDGPDARDRAVLLREPDHNAKREKTPSRRR
jgi:hypothetical protein